MSRGDTEHHRTESLLTEHVQEQVQSIARQLGQTGCDRRLEHDPPGDNQHDGCVLAERKTTPSFVHTHAALSRPNAPLGTTRLDHPATVEEVVAIQCTVEAGLQGFDFRTRRMQNDDRSI